MGFRTISIVCVLSLALVINGCAAPITDTPVTDTTGMAHQEEREDEELSSLMIHTRTTLYVANLNGEQVETALETQSNGTGAFVLDVSQDSSTLTYDLTFDGFTTAPPTQIVLRNAGEGGVGEIVHVLCGGPDGQACPQGTGGTLSGKWTNQDPQPLTPELVHEIAALRIYVAIATPERELGEIRGQLGTNPLMLPSFGFVSRMMPAPGVAAEDASGTGAFFLTLFPDGTQQLTYNVTVTGLSSPLTSAEVLNDGTSMPLDRDNLRVMTMPAMRLSASGRGGTIAGVVERNTVDAVSLRNNAERLMIGNFAVLITTEANKDGEMIGVLEPLE